MKNILAHFHTLVPLSSETERALTARLTPCRFPKKTLLVSEGRRTGAAFFIERGLTRSCKDCSAPTWSWPTGAASSTRTNTAACTARTRNAHPARRRTLCGLLPSVSRHGATGAAGLHRVVSGHHPAHAEPAEGAEIDVFFVAGQMSGGGRCVPLQQTHKLNNLKNLTHVKTFFCRLRGLQAPL